MPANLKNIGTLEGPAGFIFSFGTPVMGFTLGRFGYNQAFDLPRIGASSFNFKSMNESFGFSVYNMPSNFSNSVLFLV